jgi:hypothetical protein
MPASGVSEQIIIDHLQDTVNFSQCNGQPYAGSFTRVRASDLILNPNIGLRIPDASMAPKNFRMATIIVSRDGLLSPQAMSFYSKFAFRAELRDRTPVRVGFSKTLGKPFYVSTRGLGTLQTRLTQDCSMTFDPAQLNIGRAGGTGSFIVNAPPTCSWSAIAAQTYLGLVNSHGQGGVLSRFRWQQTPVPHVEAPSLTAVPSRSRKPEPGHRFIHRPGRVSVKRSSPASNARILP